VVLQRGAGRVRIDADEVEAADVASGGVPCALEELVRPVVQAVGGVDPVSTAGLALTNAGEDQDVVVVAQRPPRRPSRQDSRRDRQRAEKAAARYHDGWDRGSRQPAAGGCRATRA